MTPDFSGQRVYLDANVFIYALESQGPFTRAAQLVLTNVCNRTSVALTSELTLTEVLVIPLRTNNKAAIALYEAFLTDVSKIELLPVTRTVLRLAAELRATNGTKLPDAIHIASALDNRCSTFISQDKRIKAPSILAVFALSEFNAALDG